MKRKRPEPVNTNARFGCPYEGCNKSFVRREHLSRHHLNHEPKQIFQCDQCPKQFIRPDLLHRHQDRHRKGMHYRRSGGVVSMPSNPNTPTVPDANSLHTPKTATTSTTVTIASPTVPPPHLGDLSPAVQDTKNDLSPNRILPPDAAGLSPKSARIELFAAQNHPTLAYSQPLEQIPPPPPPAPPAQQKPAPVPPSAQQPPSAPRHSITSATAAPMDPYVSQQSVPPPPPGPPPGVAPPSAYDHNVRPPSYAYRPYPPQQPPQHMPPFQQTHPDATPSSADSSSQELAAASSYQQQQQQQQQHPHHRHHQPPPQPGHQQQSQFNGIMTSAAALPVFGDSFYSPSSAPMSFDDLHWLFSSQDFIDTSAVSSSQASFGIETANGEFNSLSLQQQAQQQQIQPLSQRPQALPLSIVDQAISSSSANISPVVPVTIPNTAIPQPSVYTAPQQQNTSAPDNVIPCPAAANPNNVYVESVTARYQDPTKKFRMPASWMNSWDKARDRLILALGYDSTTDPFFSPVNLHNFVQIYFDNYHSHFPILHPPTCDPANMPPLLFASIVTLGSTLSTEEKHWLTAIEIHEHLRWRIFSDAAFLPAPLWVLQALLLSQAFEKMFSTRRHHEVAHIFHGAIITLMRRGRSYTSLPVTMTPDEKDSAERQWYRWIEAEATKRTAYFAYIMDAQHSALFGHNPSLTANDIRLSLPCSEQLWEISDPTEWIIEFEKHGEPQAFLPALKSLLNQHPLPPNCPAFMKFCLLHGLYSVAWHLEHRDAAALGVSSKATIPRVSTPLSDTSAPATAAIIPSSSAASIGSNSPRNNYSDDWSQTLLRAIDCWARCLTTAHTDEEALCQEAALPLYRMSYITVSAKVNDFHIFAGAQSLLGRPLGERDYRAAEAAVRSWSASKGAKRALQHALCMVQETMFRMEIITRGRKSLYSAAEENIALRPWCLYLSTIVIWAYGYVNAGPCPTLEQAVPAPTTEECYVQAERFLTRMISSLQENSVLLNPNDTYGVVAIVRHALTGARWELLKDARVTLGKLIDQLE